MLTFNVLLPFASGIISTIFAVLVFRRYAAHTSAGRRGAHLLLWGIGMVFYAIGGYCEAYYGAFGWSSLVFRLPGWVRVRSTCWQSASGLAR
jgi:hypothetical protein